MCFLFSGLNKAKEPKIEVEIKPMDMEAFKERAKVIADEAADKAAKELSIFNVMEKVKEARERVKKYKENQLKWDRRFLGLAQYYSSFSKDPSTKVGAVLVNEDRIVVGMGYNGFPRGVEDTEERLNNRELKYKIVCHAEVNAIINAGHRAKDCTLYVWPAFVSPPICNECCKVAIQAGITRIVGYKGDEESEVAKRWKESILISRDMCKEAGIEVVELEEIK